MERRKEKKEGKKKDKILFTASLSQQKDNEKKTMKTKARNLRNGQERKKNITERRKFRMSKTQAAD